MKNKFSKVNVKIRSIPKDFSNFSKGEDFSDEIKKNLEALIC